jgi:hypothetical protein
LVPPVLEKTSQVCFPLQDLIFCTSAALFFGQGRYRAIAGIRQQTSSCITQKGVEVTAEQLSALS